MGDGSQVIAREGAIPAFCWQNLNDHGSQEKGSATLSTLCKYDGYSQDFDAKVLEGSNRFCVGNSETTSLWDQSGKLLGQIQMPVIDDGYLAFGENSITSSMIFFKASDADLIVPHKIKDVFDSPSRYVVNAAEYCPPEVGSTWAGVSMTPVARSNPKTDLSIQALMMQTSSVLIRAVTHRPAHVSL